MCTSVFCDITKGGDLFFFFSGFRKVDPVKDGRNDRTDLSQALAVLFAQPLFSAVLDYFGCRLLSFHNSHKLCSAMNK